jgi:hypothetical protein
MIEHAQILSSLTIAKGRRHSHLTSTITCPSVCNHEEDFTDFTVLFKDQEDVGKEHLALRLPTSLRKNFLA